MKKVGDIKINNKPKKEKIKLKEFFKKATESNEDSKKSNIAFQIIAAFCIIIFAMAITPRSFQNDTFYTIKLGQYVRENGIDYQDHWSWHENLPYMYPHWLYDVGISAIFDAFGGEAGNGFQALYYTVMINTVIMGLVMYMTSRKLTKSDAVSFILTLGQLYMMKPYIACRAQLVTFVLFVLTIFFIEKFLEKGKVRYAIPLILIPLLIANLHSAVFPFYYILYLPYIVEFAIVQVLDWHLLNKIKKLYYKIAINLTKRKLTKTVPEKVEEIKTQISNIQNEEKLSDEKFEKYLLRVKERRNNPYKLKLERKDFVPILIIIMLISLLTGLLTPIKDMPYTYTYRIMKGNTTASINEHTPLQLIDNKPLMVCLAVIIALIGFSKVKIRLRDVFFLAGLTLLSFMTKRQVSMLVLIGGMIFARLITDFADRVDPNGTKILKEYVTTAIGEVLTVILVMALSYYIYKPISTNPFVTSAYPVKASAWIKENMDYKNMKMFNDYNYGSYLLMQDIPVFIDSRCDLYTPEFNGEYSKEKGKYEGEDIFSEFLNVSSIALYYDSQFSLEQITHVITKSNSKLNMLLSRDDGYKKIYQDGSFNIYLRLASDGEDPTLKEETGDEEVEEVKNISIENILENH